MAVVKKAEYMGATKGGESAEVVMAAAAGSPRRDNV